MFSHVNLLVLCVLGFVLSWPCNSVAGFSNQDICSLQTQNQTFAIFLAGTYRPSNVDHYLLITRSADYHFAVYDSPWNVAFSEETPLRMHLLGVKAIPLASKFPRLFNNTIFQQIKNRPLNEILTFTVTHDDQHNYLIIYQQPPKVSLQYNIDTDTVTQLQYNPNFRINNKQPHAIISLPDSLLMGMYRNETETNLQLSTYDFSPNGSIRLVAGNSSLFSIRLCRLDNATVQVISPDESTEKCASQTLPGPIQSGWKLGSTLILFTNHKVYTFYGVSERSRNYSFVEMDFGDFFKCTVDVPISQDICTLQSYNQTYQIFLSGTLNESVYLLITRSSVRYSPVYNHQVYELPGEAQLPLSVIRKSVSLFGINSTSLSSKYPSLYRNAIFRRLSESPLNDLLTFTYRDDNSKHNNLVLYQNSTQICLQYDIDADRVTQVTTDLVLPFMYGQYGNALIQLKGTHRLFAYTSTYQTTQLVDYAIVNGSFSKTVRETLNYRFCPYDSWKIEIVNQSQGEEVRHCTVPAPLHWPIRSGWNVAPRYWILFADSSVYTVSVWHYSWEAEYEQVTFETFFKCNNSSKGAIRGNSNRQLFENIEQSGDEEEGTSYGAYNKIAVFWNRLQARQGVWGFFIILALTFCFIFTVFSLWWARSKKTQMLEETNLVAN